VISRWLRRLLGIDALDARIAALEGHRPDGRWPTEDDPSRKASAVDGALRKPSTGLTPGPGAPVSWLYDHDWQPKIQHGPYL
jgi:hypothetical protein